MHDTNKDPLQGDNQKQTTSKSSLWSIDDGEMERQVGQYDKLKIYQSCRGISTLILLGGLILSTFLQALLSTPLIFLSIEIAIVSFLIYFIYRGHRWAMALFILSFTANLLVTSFNRVLEGTFSVSSAIILGGIWVLVVSTLVKAIRVENFKRKSIPEVRVGTDTPEPILVNEAFSKHTPVPVVAGKNSRHFSTKHWIIAFVGLVVSIGSFLFWWYEIRVAEIKRECSWVERIEPEKPVTSGMTTEEAERLNDANRQENDPRCEDSTSGVSGLLERYKLNCKKTDYVAVSPTPYVPENKYFVQATEEEYQLCLRHKGLR